MGDAPLWFKLCFYGIGAGVLVIWVKVLWDILAAERRWTRRMPASPKKGLAPARVAAAGGAAGADGGIGVIGSHESTLDITPDSSVQIADVSYDSGGSDSGGGDSGGDFSGGGGDYGGGGSGGSWS